VVLCHDTLPDGDFRDVVAIVNPTLVVVLSRFAEWDHYLAALRDGAFDYIACPPDPDETERIVRSDMTTGFEEIGSRAALRSATFPPTGLGLSRPAADASRGAGETVVAKCLELAAFRCAFRVTKLLPSSLAVRPYACHDNLRRA
jgi:hypothetical protein